MPPPLVRIRSGEPPPFRSPRIDVREKVRVVSARSDVTPPPEADASIDNLAAGSTAAVTPPPDVDSSPPRALPGAKFT